MENIMDIEKDCDLQSIFTVSQMASKLGLSQARLYQLIDDGVFPPPAYCCLSKKPVYPSRLQETCLEIRNTGIGWNDQLVRFYKQRKKAKPKPEHKQLTAILRKLGLSVTISQVRKASRRLGLSITSKEPINGETIQKLIKYFNGDCQKGV
jgi:hypothetical protein